MRRFALEGVSMYCRDFFESVFRVFNEELNPCSMSSMRSILDWNFLINHTGDKRQMTSQFS